MAQDVQIPFNARNLDNLLKQAGIDVVLATSKHNIQYLLGGYRYFFFANFDALGVSRYLPILLYVAGKPESTTYFGNDQETAEVENGRFWCPTTETRFWGTLDVIDATIDRLRRLGLESARIGVEHSFLPADSMDRLRAGLPGVTFVEAFLPLERLRAVKTRKELDAMRDVSERVVASMLDTFASARLGMTKRQIFDLLSEKESARGLRFDFCQITVGTGFNRAPNNAVLKAGDIVSLDSGGALGGYFGDLCRMGVAGEPDRELIELLQFVDDIQSLARKPIRAGALGRTIYEIADEKIKASPLAANVSFVAHGMGIIGHEAPRLSARGPVAYPAHDADLPLQENMAISIETTLMHPTRGFIKLEDTVAVTANGCEGYGDGGRGWNAIPV